MALWMEFSVLRKVNCRHHFYAFIDGVSEPTYSEADLEALKGENHKFTFEGVEYDGYSATQAQRALERSIRKWKRREAAAVTDEEKTVYRARLRTLNTKYKAFSKAAGLPEQRDRMKVV